MSPLSRITLNKREYFRIDFLSQGNHRRVPNNSENGHTRSSHLRKNCGKIEGDFLETFIKSASKM